MKDSKIEWTDHTVNFWWGCTEVSPACANCYAREQARFFGARIFGSAVRWGKGMPRFERLEAARKDARKLDTLAFQKQTRFKVFCNSMSDWLDDEVPIEWLAFLLKTIRETPHLDWQLLTKRPEQWAYRIGGAEGYLRCADSWTEMMLRNWLNGEAPPNVWVGTTVEDQVRAEERIPALIKIPARVRYLSCEPLLGPLELGRWLAPERGAEVHFSGDREALGNEQFRGAMAAMMTAAVRWHRGIHWVIAGGESGKSVDRTRPMHPRWLYDLMDQVTEADVPFLFKQWGAWCPAPAAHLEGRKELLRGEKFLDGTLMLFAGKELAGREMLGRTWDEFPGV